VRDAVAALRRRPTPSGSRATRSGRPSSRRSSCCGRCTGEDAGRVPGRARRSRWRSSRCSARWPRSTAPRGRPGRRSCAARTRRPWQPPRRSTPTGSPSGAGCSCSSTSSSPGSAAAWPSASSTTWP
jgi:hypothetical protein